jgi:hypothetical protein
MNDNYRIRILLMTYAKHFCFLTENNLFTGHSSHVSHFYMWTVVDNTEYLHTSTGTPDRLSCVIFVLRLWNTLAMLICTRALRIREGKWWLYPQVVLTAEPTRIPTKLRNNFAPDS